jgi:hypothetical protein
VGAKFTEKVVRQNCLAWLLVLYPRALRGSELSPREFRPLWKIACIGSGKRDEPRTQNIPELGISEKIVRLGLPRDQSTKRERSRIRITARSTAKRVLEDQLLCDGG